MNEAIKKIKEWWVVLALAATLISTWTTFENRLNTLEKVQYELRETVKQQEPVFLQIQKDIVEIKTTLEFIKTKV